MSRDRLGALRAQQAAQRTQNRNPSYPDNNDSSYSNGGAARGYGQDSNDQYGQFSSIPAPPGYPQASQNPSYLTRSNDGGNPNRRVYEQDQYMQSPSGENDEEDEDSRGQRARAQSRRRPSQAQGMSPPPQSNYGRQQYNEEYSIPPVPRSQDAPRSRSQRRQQQRQPQQAYGQDQYGGREDDAAYYEKNASQVALSNKYEDAEKYKGYPPHAQDAKTRNLTGYQQNPQTYQVPTLQKHDQRSNGYHQAFAPPTPSPVMNGDSNIISNAPVIDMNAFFDEIGSIRSDFRELESHIGYLDQLHNRNLTGAGGDEISMELEQVAEATRKLTNSLRNRIKEVQETTRIRTHGHAEQERQTRKAQIGAVREKFLEIVQSYQNMEMRNRDKAKHKIERQYQIVKPDATPEEIRQVVEGGQEVQVFAQALRQSQRSADARGVLNEVQNRHEDIKKIERTLVELFHLFQDMAIMVEEQDEQVIQIEQKAEEVARDMEIGHKEITAAVGSAKGARKKRKICFIILIILLLIIGGVIAYVVVKIVIPKVNENKAKAAAEQQPVRTVTATATTTHTAARSAADGDVPPTTTRAQTSGAATAASPTSATAGIGGGANNGSPVPSEAAADVSARGLEDLD